MFAALVVAGLVTHGVMGLTAPPQAGASQEPPAVRQTAPEEPWPPPGVLRTGREIAAPRLIKEIKPRYTAAAIRDKIQGSVTMEAIINTDGTVGEVRVTRSLRPDLDQQAIAALKGWRFAPPRKDGQATRVLVEIEMTFTLRR
jgi:TonB family protein